MCSPIVFTPFVVSFDGTQQEICIGNALEETRKSVESEPGQYSIPGVKRLY
jgi:hypothetical protein